MDSGMIGKIQKAKRYAVLGDMLELGPYEKQGHELVGVRAAQVAEISNAGSGRQGGRGRGGTPAPEISTAAIPRDSPLAARLERVPDIQAETVVGRLPRLPREIPAVYRDRADGRGEIG